MVSVFCPDVVLCVVVVAVGAAANGGGSDDVVGGAVDVVVVDGGTVVVVVVSDDVVVVVDGGAVDVVVVVSDVVVVTIEAVISVIVLSADVVDSGVRSPLKQQQQKFHFTSSHKVIYSMEKPISYAISIQNLNRNWSKPDMVCDMVLPCIIIFYQLHVFESILRFQRIREAV